MPQRLTGEAPIEAEDKTYARLFEWQDRTDHGAGQGIGRAITEAFVRAEATVIATDRDATSLQGLPCRVESLDVCDQDAIRTVLASASRLDVLVNCAGFVHQGTLLDVDDEDWSRSLIERTLNVLDHASRVPRMIVGGGGSIINIASVVSSIKAAPQRFVYSATKAL